ncbi:MAG: hypothetical protein NZ601_00330, partial [candidate division WOR-3 bacterium]|nr:hypothetical protein [candidate division WOR-3 bacterium]
LISDLGVDYLNLVVMIKSCGSVIKMVRVNYLTTGQVSLKDEGRSFRKLTCAGFLFCNITCSKQ